MKFVTGHVIPVSDIATGVLVLAVFAAWVALVALSILALRRAGPGAVKGALGGGGLVLAGVTLGALLFLREQGGDVDAERRAVEARANDLVVRAIAPGSALACLDPVASNVVEAACEKALFATFESVVSALAYVNAQYALLASSAALAERDPSYRPAVERLRRSLEQDRFGLVAQVLSTRGCADPGCADFAILRDSTRILANMKDNIFATRVAGHALAWTPDAAPALAAAPPAKTAAPADVAAVAAPGTPHKKYEFPSSESIPPVSIMGVETDKPPLADFKPDQPKEPKKPAPHPRAARAQAPPPVAIVPQAQSQPQTSGSQ